MNRKRKSVLVFYMAIVVILATGCSIQAGGEESQIEIEETEIAESEMVETQEISAIFRQSGQNAEIDFAALQEENPEIFGWLYIPDTTIDYPLLQSQKADDYYESHNAEDKADETGALYIEAATLASMCDFNTVIHGKANFADLYRFADIDYFDSHEKAYVYLPDNVLTYEIFAAYRRENTSLIRTYDFTEMTGCQQFLDDMYGTREMDMNIRTGWKTLTPYHFLITLTVVREDKPEEQYVVLAALIEDAAGTIDRVIYE